MSPSNARRTAATIIMMKAPSPFTLRSVARQSCMGNMRLGVEMKTARRMHDDGREKRRGGVQGYAIIIAPWDDVQYDRAVRRKSHTETA